MPSTYSRLKAQFKSASLLRQKFSYYDSRCLMGVTLQATFVANCLVFDDRTFSLAANRCDTIAGQMLHCAMTEKFVATSREALRKVELHSTFRKGFCNLSRNVFGRCNVCYTEQCFVQPVSRLGVARLKLNEKLYSVNAPERVL